MLAERRGRSPLANLRFKQNPKLRCGRNSRRVLNDDKLRAYALDTTALISQLGRERKMNMQR